MCAATATLFLKCKSPSCNIRQYSTRFLTLLCNDTDGRWGIGSLRLRNARFHGELQIFGQSVKLQMQGLQGMEKLEVDCSFAASALVHT